MTHRDMEKGLGVNPQPESSNKPAPTKLPAGTVLDKWPVFAMVTVLVPGALTVGALILALGYRAVTWILGAGCP